MGFTEEGLNVIYDIIAITTMFFNIFFLYIIILYGPSSLIGIHYPHTRLHGIITLVPIFAVVILI